MTQSYQADDGTVYVFEEESANTPAISGALKQRQEECIAAEGIFFPELNKCCDATMVTSPGFNPTQSCGDPLVRKALADEAKHNQKLMFLGLGVGALLLIGGVAWWYMKSHKRSENPTEDPHDLDVLAKHGEWLTQEDVAKNPHATPSTLAYLLRVAEEQNNKELLQALLLNPNLPSQLRQLIDKQVAQG